MTEQLNYVPHKLRSHPFRCLSLPWILVFLVIFYWFSLVPILYTYYVDVYSPNSIEKYVFLGAHFVIFIVILALLVCLWRINPSKDKVQIGDLKNGFYTIVQADHIDNYSDYLRASVDESSFADVNSDELPTLRIDIEKAAIFREKYDERPVSQNLEVALTPRELFFRDLYESAIQTRNSLTLKFLENERKYCSENINTWDDVKNRTSSDSVEIRKEPNNDDGVAEYFIANIPQRKSLVNEVFLYVDSEAGKLTHEKIRYSAVLQKEEMLLTD